MTAKYTIKVPLPDGTYRERVVIDENRNIFVDEIRVNSASLDISQADLSSSSPNFIDLNIRGGAHGYALGGGAGGPNPTAQQYSHEPNLISTDQNIKFPFAFNGATFTDVGNLTVARHEMMSSQSTTHGYTAGGLERAPSTITISNIIDKFPFSAGGNSTDVGDLTVARSNCCAGQTSNTHGYAAAGGTGGSFTNPEYGPGCIRTTSNVIDKYPFSSDANATDVGDVAVAVVGACGISSETHGYYYGGKTGTIHTTVDDFGRFPFASDGNATNITDLGGQYGGYHSAGMQSETHGFINGGLRNPPNSFNNEANYAMGNTYSFPFASDTDTATSLHPAPGGGISPYNGGRGTSSSDTHAYVFGGYLNDTLRRFPWANAAVTEGISGSPNVPVWSNPSQKGIISGTFR